MSSPDATESHRSGSLYGAFAYAVVVLTSYAGFFSSQRYYTSEWMVPVVFACGAAYASLGVLSDRCLENGGRGRYLVYYLIQCALLTAVIFLSPVRGFLGILVLPLMSQAIFDLRPRYATVVGLYLFGINIALWAIPYGWQSGLQAVINYSAAFTFTIAFTLITKQALNSREREERLRQEVETANQQLLAQASQAEDLATTRERNRLAREIHDGVGHYLTVVKTQLDAAAALMPTQPERARISVLKASQLTLEALEDVRRSVGTLRTDTARPPLADSIRALAVHADPAPAIHLLGTPRPLSAATEHALFRATQEALTNIRKHARATAASITLDFRQPERIRLTVTDNGAGSADASPTASGGYGLLGLRERIEILGGKFATTRAATGFTLTAEVPA